jgi:hypothetical protein
VRRLRGCQIANARFESMRCWKHALACQQLRTAAAEELTLQENIPHEENLVDSTTLLL